jgi:glucan phosphoethanolaminetransferase (alkaline phosphatase superfamily)
MMVVSSFILPKFKNSFKLTVAFWILSIFLSLFVGDSLETFFANLGFDDRLNNYITSEDDNEMFSSVDFRWDFLLYGMMPIILGWHVVVKKRVSDKTYLMLLNTYVLCNSFWIMLIRASFSARFAYLSWFIYPMLLAYPLLKLPVWRKQGEKLNWIMLANIGFTYFMWLIGK